VTATPYAIRSVNASSADTATTATSASTATNATQLGGVAASQYVQTNDSRLADPRPPTAGSLSYVQNSTNQQAGVSFNISGNGIVGGTVSAASFNIGANRVLSTPSFSGTSSTLVGVNAGQANTVGTNTFVGESAGRVNTGGTFNSFFGFISGQQNTAGTDNSFFGANAGINSTGSSNSFFGRAAGQSNTAGGSNVAIGAFADVGSLNLTNATAIGTCAVVRQSNSIVLGTVSSDIHRCSPVPDTNVGIGTTAPSKRLEVGTSAIADGINLFGNAPAFFLSDTGKNERATLAYAGSAGLYSADAAAGDVVLRTTSGRLLLQHGTGGAGLILNSSGTVSIPTLGSSGITQLCRNGPNEISTCSSSLRYKTNVATFTGGLDVINRLRPISFTWKQGGLRDIGLGAEEVETVEPLLTFRNANGEIEGVKYNQLSAVFINAFKELQAQIKKQQEQLNREEDQIRQERAAFAAQQRQLVALKKLICRSHAKAAVCK
jgi:hypothetical protein